MLNKILGVVVLGLLSFNSQALIAKKTIGILVFDGVLTSDITAPAEVFGAATKQSWFTDYEVKMIGVTDQSTITTEEGLIIMVDTNIDELKNNEEQNLAALIVPSAYDMQPLLDNKVLINFIQSEAEQVQWLASNCSGAYLLAESGLLTGKKATTWFGGEDDLKKQYPKVLVQSDKNYVIDGNIITSNGSVVSYTASIKLLELMSSSKLAQEVFDALQLGRLILSY